MELKCYKGEKQGAVGAVFSGRCNRWRPVLGTASVVKI